jgi:hypothetical protein
VWQGGSARSELPGGIAAAPSVSWLCFEQGLQIVQMLGVAALDVARHHRFQQLEDPAHLRAGQGGDLRAAPQRLKGDAPDRLGRGWPVAAKRDALVGREFGDLDPGCDSLARHPQDALVDRADPSGSGETRLTSTKLVSHLGLFSKSATKAKTASTGRLIRVLASTLIMAAPPGAPGARGRR